MNDVLPSPDLENIVGLGEGGFRSLVSEQKLIFQSSKNLLCK